MKKNLLILVSMVSTVGIAQNTLPTSGNVGIGTTTPTADLEVMGTTKLGSVAVKDTAIFDKPVIIKDSVTLEKRLTVDQDVKIKGQTIMVDDATAKADLKILGTTKMKGDAIVEGTFKFKSLSDSNALGDRLLLINTNGKAKYGIEIANLGITAYESDCKIQPGGLQPLPLWKTISNTTYGALYTGTQCPARVGIGTDSPDYALEVIGITQSTGIRLKDFNGQTYLKNTNSGIKNCLVVQGDYTSLNFSDSDPNNVHSDGVWGIEYNPGAGGLNFWKPFSEFGFDNYLLFLNNNGNVGIGTEKTPYKLSVNGSIGARLVKVELDTWSDHVFENNYSMLTIEELEQYVMQNKHLPNIPSESEVLENGIDLGQTDALLLEKIEELTLYIIQLKKEYEKMKLEVEELNTQLNR